MKIKNYLTLFLPFIMFFKTNAMNKTKKLNSNSYSEKLLFAIVGQKPINSETQTPCKKDNHKQKINNGSQTSNLSEIIKESSLYQQLENENNKNKKIIKEQNKIIKYKEDINERQEELIECYADEYNKKCGCSYLKCTTQ